MKKIILFMLLGVALPMFAAKWYPARIEMSDNKEIKGQLSIMGNRPIIISPVDSKYRRKLKPEDIVSITQKYEQKTMNQPWMYKEAGKVEKVYFDGKYPFIDFLTEIVLVSGEVIRGHIVAVPFRFKGKGPNKLFLTRQIKGSTGEKFDDLLYPMKVTFLNRVRHVPPIMGTVTGFGKLLKVTAMDNQRATVCFAELKGDSFLLDNLLPGTYDIYILTDSYALCGLSGGVPDKAAGDPIPANAMEQINKAFPKADDFFPDRWILKAAGTTGFTKTLVYKRRAEYYAAKKHTPGGYIWHLDVWNWHKAGDEWKIDTRCIMLRHKQKGGEKTRKLYQIKALENVKPGADIILNFKDGENGRKFIRNLD